jgi:hypothetical protein
VPRGCKYRPLNGSPATKQAELAEVAQLLTGNVLPFMADNQELRFMAENVHVI